MSADVDMRTMTPADLARVLDWAAAEGWNPGLDDAARFHAADPDGFLVAERDGMPAAAISVVRLGSAHGFLGLFICRPELRGQGIGSALWRAGMARVEGRAVGLDGVVAQQKSYARSGFTPSHRTLRFAGKLPAVPSPQVRAAAPEDAAGIVRLDRRATGLDRAAFLAAWTAPAPDHLVRVLPAEGRLRGVAVLRRCRTGWKIGPLLAEDFATAEALLGDLGAAAEGAQVMLDVPEPNAKGLALARAAGLVQVFETARMWRGTPPEEDLAVTYGVATLELG